MDRRSFLRLAAAGAAAGAGAAALGAGWATLGEPNWPVVEQVSVSLPRLSAQLDGLDDVWESKQDPRAALAGTPADECKLLLVHEPDYADEAARYPVDLQLSGHSHGGQINLPYYGPPVLPYLGQKYPAGLYQVGKLAVYTNRGIGVIAPPIRLNCPPEVTLLTLHAAPPTTTREAPPRQAPAAPTA
jgi:predicted MPP superfamily phosphohydrolase